MERAQILEEIGKMTVLELSQLIKDMEEKFGVSAAAAVAVAGPAAGAAAAAPKEEKTEFTVMNKTANGGPKRLAKGTKVTKEYLDGVEKYDWFDIRLAAEEAAAQVEGLKESLAQKRREFDAMIADDNGRERERHKVPYGATLQGSDGDQVKAGKQLAVWDPHHRPIITEYAGTVKFEHVEEGSTVAKQIDDVTGLSTLVVIDAKRRTTAASKGQRPSVKLVNEAGDEVRIAGTDHGCPPARWIARACRARARRRSRP